MRIFCLTEVGKVAVKKLVDSESEEARVLRFLRDNKTGTDSELDVVGGRYVVRKLCEHGLVKELTN